MFKIFEILKILAKCISNLRKYSNIQYSLKTIFYDNYELTKWKLHNNSMNIIDRL